MAVAVTEICRPQIRVAQINRRHHRIPNIRRIQIRPRQIGFFQM
jgi:hypothetical protein